MDRQSPLLIEHKSTELYYTSTAWAIEKLTHTQGRQTPHKLSTVLQSPTTPGYYYLLKNLDIPHANQAQVYKSPTTPWQYELLRNWDKPRSDWPPANWAQVYWAVIHQYSMSYWEINTYPG